MNTKFIPAVFAENDRAHIPLALQRYNHYLPVGDGYEELYRLLTGQPKAAQPVLGRLRALATKQPQADFHNALWNVPARNPWYTGREPDLQAIHRVLTATKAAALTGIGGIGKTQTAIEYAHRHRADYKAVFWSRADRDAPLLSGFAALAHTLDLPERNEKEQSVVAGGVTRWLAANSQWLLLLDNVDTVEDLNLVRRLIPSVSGGYGGHVLITTRLHATGGIAGAVEINRMEPQDGALLLLRRAGLIQRKAPLEAALEADRMTASRITNELDGLALALDQAGAFIEEMPSTPAEYLDLYLTEGARLRKRRGEMAAEHPSVTVTFSLAFSGLAERHSAAADLLRVCAFLAPDAIPEEIFTHGGAKLGEPLGRLATKPLDFAEAIRDAGRFALIRRDASMKSLHMHRQVQEVLKDEMDEASRHLWAERVVATTAYIFPDPQFRNWPQCERLLPHARAASRQIAEPGGFEAAILLYKTASYLSDRAEYGEAEPLYLRALAIYEKALGPTHLETATCLNRLAMLYTRQGRYEEAEPLYQRVLATREKALGPDHPDTGISLNNLAVLYHDQERYKKAEPLYRRALAIWENTLGPEHADTATCLDNLAELYRAQVRHEEAEPLYLRALAIHENALGPDDPAIATSLSNLALLYIDQDRYDEAEPLHRRALTIREKALGPDHPDTGISLDNLASLCDRQSRLEEAEPLYLRALVIYENALGPDHPATANCLNNLALHYYYQGRYEDTEALYRRTIAIREKALGPDHSRTGKSLQNLASFYYTQGRYDEAEPLYRRALAIREKALGPDRPDNAILP
jgi:tetratricopeptide (TPR) repeat protein